MNKLYFGYNIKVCVNKLQPELILSYLILTLHLTPGTDNLLYKTPK